MVFIWSPRVAVRLCGPIPTTIAHLSEVGDNLKQEPAARLLLARLLGPPSQP